MSKPHYRFIMSKCRHQVQKNKRERKLIFQHTDSWWYSVNRQQMCYVFFSDCTTTGNMLSVDSNIHILLYNFLWYHPSYSLPTWHQNTYFRTLLLWQLLNQHSAWRGIKWQFDHLRSNASMDIFRFDCLDDVWLIESVQDFLSVSSSFNRT